MLLDQAGICASSGSACTTGSLDPSHVLSAMGLSPMRARGCIRFSLGIYNTDEDVNHLLKHLPPIIAKLRANSPLSPEHPDNNPDTQTEGKRGRRKPAEVLIEKDK
jgi:cysteine desulfurase